METCGQKYCERIHCKLTYFVLILVISVVTVLVYLDNVYTLMPTFSSGRYSTWEDYYTDKFDDFIVINKTRKTLLVWTTFFKSMYWADQIRTALHKCSSSCEVTTDRKMLKEADAVLFHHGDIDIADLPQRYRHQPWILFTLEPTTLIQGNQNRWANMFNWTMSYRTYSTIFNPYGFYENRTVSVNYDVSFHSRNKSMISVISRCHDDARRYKLIHSLEDYFRINVYGACSPNGLKCTMHDNFYCIPPDETKKYKFRLAFENSNCRDYITEKYWTSLLQGVVPIVNWKDHQKNNYVVPNSYINLFDFSDMLSAIKYIKEVSQNETLYSSYFEWKKKFKPVSSMYSGFCRLCDKLSRPFRAQVYRDLQRWFVEDTCTKYNVSSQL